MDRVGLLKGMLEISKINHKDAILNEPGLKDAHIYCLLHKIPSQAYGVLLENYIITRFNFTRNNASHCTGDCSKHDCNIEIKSSLGGQKRNKFNFVQIRLNPQITFFIFTAFYLCPENVNQEGELFIFKIPLQQMKQLVLNYGGYAHGTIKEHGKIVSESLEDAENKREYAIRPVFNDKCWKALMLFRIQESEL